MSTRSDISPIAPPTPSEVAGTDAPTPPAPAPVKDPSVGIKDWLVPFLVLAVVQIGAPFIPVINPVVGLVGISVLTLVYVGGVVAFALGMARQVFPMRTLVVGFALSALAFGAFQIAPRFPFNYVLQSFVLLSLGTFFGLLVARLIKHANMIGPIGVLVALIDIWGVLFGGIVAQLLTNKATQQVATRAMAGGPRLGSATSKVFLALPDIGIGDYLFLSFFLGAIVWFGMNWRASAIWMWALVSVALLAIILPTGVPALPGLLFLGAGAVLPNLKYFHFTREERFALLYAGIFVVILTGMLYRGFTSMLPPNSAPKGATLPKQLVLPKQP